ncbi:hypothetical protein [Methanococcoides burtonii]|uniref:Uncharacterized protein n=1 Tax=Methanococcoides burtonii (strain DSM 6242 / NBRC 107633 / OCM 468 / ACE-M) TaxID=259564 RepID=Q12VA8_METBU|nr:hypothetical protein [Methanococcoides burtonii]ABE52618.1 Hypothetical protein Mbur_1726 [Methanococcoides burtonii DSM 6242]
MDILITTIIDSLIVIGLTAAILFFDILIRNHLKMDLSEAAPDLTMAAFAMQISVITALLISGITSDLAIDSILLVFFTLLWAVTIWQSSKRRAMNHNLSFIIASVAFTISASHLINLHDPIIFSVVIAIATILGYGAASITRNLYNEKIAYRFDEMMGKITSYDLVEASSKNITRDVDDPLSAAVDSIRCAVRNHDEDSFKKGLDKITVSAKNLMTGARDTTVIAKHMNFHLLEIGFIAASRDETATECVVHSIGVIGKAASKHGSQDGAVLSLRSLTSLFDDIKGRTSTQLNQQFVRSIGDITEAAAGSRHEEAVEKGLLLLKDIGNNAIFAQDTSTMIAVTNQLLELARISTRYERANYSRLVVLTIRDIGIRSIQEKTQERQDGFKKLVGSLRSMGKFFDQKDALEVVRTMQDLGVIAAREYSEEELSHVINELNDVGLAALKNNSGELMQQTVVSMKDICLAAMCSELEGPVKTIAELFSRMGKQGPFAITIQDAVMDIGDQRTDDDKFYTLFLRTYENTGR